MSPEPRKRPRRIPYTPEEVATIIEVKKRREFHRLRNFKRSRSFKLQNYFTVGCFFIYWEVIFCFFGPATYRRHYTRQVVPHYGERYDSAGRPVVSEIDFRCVDGGSYKFIINDFITVPPKYGSFTVASDFLLHKPLKGRIGDSAADYRLLAASPVLLLILITIITSMMAYGYNFNENAYSLMALTVLNGLTLLAIVCF